MSRLRTVLGAWLTRTPISTRVDVSTTKRASQVAATIQGPIIEFASAAGPPPGLNVNPSPVLPYFHLRSDGFWHLLPVPGQEAALAQLRQVSAMLQLKTLVLGVALDPALSDLLSASSTRAELRRVLLAAYLTPDARSRVVEAAQLVDDTLEHGQHLPGRVHERFALDAPTGGQQYRAEARSAAFQ
jgi:hypothetical protein